MKTKQTKSAILRTCFNSCSSNFLKNQTQFIRMKNVGRRKTNHEEVSQNDPQTIFLTENELQNKPNDRKLKKCPGNWINHLSFQTQLLQIRQQHRHDHHHGRSQRFQHALKKVPHPFKIHCQQQKQKQKLPRRMWVG